MINLNRDFLSELPQDIKSRFVLFLIFLFPILAPIVKGASSQILLLLLLFCMGSFRNNWNKISRQEQTILFGMVILCVSVALSLLSTENISEGSSKLERYVRLMLVIPIYFFLRMRNINSANILLPGIFIACFVMAGQAFYEREILNHPTVYAAYHRIIFADLVVLYLSIIGGAWLLLKDKQKNTLYLIAVLAGIYAVFMSGSRAALLFIPIAIVIIMFLFRHQLFKNIRYVIPVSLILFTVVGLNHEQLLKGVSKGLHEIEVYQKDNSVFSSWGTRLNMWHNSWQVFKTAPIFGTGTGDYNTDVQKLLPSGLIRTDGYAEKQKNVHSIYFQALAEGGLVGIILLLACLLLLPGYYFYYNWVTAISSEVRLFSLAGIFLVTGFAWFGASEGWLNRNVMVNSYALFLVMFMSSIANKVKPITSQTS